MLKNFSAKLTKKLGISAFVLLLAACSSQPAPPRQQAPTQEQLGVATQPAASYLKQATQVKGEAQQRLLLLAARAYVESGDFNAAAKLLNAMSSSLSQAPQFQAEYRLLISELAIHNHKRSDALALLDWPLNWPLTQAQWQHYYRLKGELYQSTAAPLSAAANFYDLSRLQPTQEQSLTRQAIWTNLSQVDEEQLRQTINTTQDQQWQGWLELAWLAKHFAIQPSSLVGELARWQRDNPNHPAASDLPQDLQRALSVQPYRPQQVAVLLPLTGRFASQAKSIQDGLMSRALEQDMGRQIQFYDTGAIDAVDAYHQAIADGAQFIIGPLTKDNVDKVLAVADKQIPMLALNQPTQVVADDNRFFFSLSPEEESMHVAEKLFQDGRTNPIVLAPASKAGLRMANAFNTAWLELTNKPVEIHHFDRKDSMQNAVRKALQVDTSLEQIKAIKGAFGNKVIADFRSRQDVDAMFIVANVEEIRLLKPFVEVNVAVFSQPPQLYTSSRANAYQDNKQARDELNGLYISDMPWLLGNTDTRQQAHQWWPERSDSQLRLYAMGYDSWALIDRLAQMRVFYGYQVQGLTGQLAVTDNGVLSRQLGWAQYQRGRLRSQQ
ncbi:penicillin-binding protein activator [Ferrimonas aestuarii]|uniref:penicillin-binding protein activator n=1 Tax=Ferrimonas aestuarii TaxID=2569539 RepID=UPI00145F6F3D|nr:penicillin-binding protein activator [Ferrimonas aestuarii]